MPEFCGNPNQRSITTHKEKCNNDCADNYYAKINLNALKYAMHRLTPKAFELWIYLSKNQDNHYFWLSKVDFLSWSNVKQTSYYDAFNELKREEYLVERNGKPNQFDFYEIPTKEKVLIQIHKEGN